MKKTILLLLLASGLLSAGEHFKERAFLLATNLLPPTKLAQVEAIAARAAKAGYNTVYLSDYSLITLCASGADIIGHIPIVARTSLGGNIES